MTLEEYVSMTLDQVLDYYDRIITIGPSAWDAMMDLSLEDDIYGREE